MNRRVISLLLVVLILLSLAACKNKKEDASIEPLPPGVMLVPEDFNAEFDSWEEETTAATEETEAKRNTSPAEESTTSTETKASEETQNANTEENKPTTPTPTVTNMTQYEWYNALSGEEQMAFMETFASMADFFEWYNAAKEEHEKENPSIEIGDGTIDLGEIIGGNG